MPREYRGTERTVVCYAQPLANGRFIGMVSVKAAGDGAMVVHKCPGSDVTSDDAVARAKAWAHVNYPVDGRPLHAQERARR
jgi:hypothetical protein